MSFLLRASHLSLHRSGRYLWQDLSLQISPSDLCLVRGKNGSGKTSLLKVLARILPPSSGEVICQASGVGYVGHHTALYPTLSIRRYLQTQIIMAGKALENLAEQLDLWELAPYADLPLAKLSLGQQKRTALARLAIGEAPLWILDEPTANLDAGAQAILWRLIANHKNKGGAIILATHQEVPLDIQHQILLENKF